MGSDAWAIVAAVAFMVVGLAVVFVPLVLLVKRDQKRGTRRRSGNGDSSISSSMNDIINLN